MAKQLWDEGKEEDAIKTLKDIADKGTTASPQAKFNLAGFLLRQEKTDDAKSLYESVLSDSEAKYLHPITLLALGDIAQAAGDEEGARAYYDRKIEDYQGYAIGNKVSDRLNILGVDEATKVPPAADAPPEPTLGAPSFPAPGVKSTPVNIPTKQGISPEVEVTPTTPTEGPEATIPPIEINPENWETKPEDGEMNKPAPTPEASEVESSPIFEGIQEPESSEEEAAVGEAAEDASPLGNFFIPQEGGEEVSERARTFAQSLAGISGGDDESLNQAYAELSKDGKARFVDRIYLELNQTELPAEDAARIQEKMKALGDATYFSVGYADTSGDAQQNRVLSYQRAQAVGGWLKANSESQVETFSMGETDRFSKTELAPNRVVEVTHASTNALVRARVWRRKLNSLTRRSWKRQAFSVIINFSAQEYDILSSTDDEGDHCEKQ